MKPERWQQVKALLQSALERESGERSAFLAGACAGDDRLRREVESLIISHEQAGSFIEEPAVEVMAESIANDQRESLEGRSFGQYRILARLGAGGMGEVYLAEDTRLGRKVALKMLPDYFTRDDERVRRFQQEARAASALNHPNIITIYEIGETDSRHFIATEFIEGSTLREHMTKGQMKIGEVHDVVTQVASALSAAHEAGIVHRDIKPENIMVRTDGIVKVLDFGLAKLTELGTGESEATTLVNTKQGMVMGTTHYMSPEQARGQKVDARTDLFSLGVVLYEMIAGRAPFEGATAGDVIVSILEKEPPPLARLSRKVPGSLERIVKKALQKNRQERYLTVKDFQNDLKDLKQILEVADQKERPRKLTSRQIVFASIAALTIASVALVSYWRSANQRWARDSLARVEELVKAEEYSEAYDLADRIQNYLPDDPALARLLPIISDDLSVATEPAGARVYLRRFVTDESKPPLARQLVGNTPFSHLKIGRGEYIIYVEKDGYAPIERTISSALSRAESTYLVPPAIELEERLIEAQKVPDRMVFIPGHEYRLVSWDLPSRMSVRLDDYFIDKFEVTNREYKEFINAGGYLKKQFWKYPFVKERHEFSWEEAMGELRDHTGLPGPRSWSNQNYPEGKAEHPVTDISWYEAAAYAEFRGKQLPTIFQWEKAARNGAITHFHGMVMPWGWTRSGDTIERRANFKGEGTVPVSSFEFGMSPYGSYNMAGNVSEWCLNEQSEGFSAPGGSWQDPAYGFGRIGAFPALYSSSALGFRCALSSGRSAGDQGAMRIITKEETAAFVPSKEVSFAALASHYRYDKTPLGPQTVEVIETDEWRREKITYAGAHDERVIAYLYLPKNSQQPFQAIQFVPGDDVMYGRSVPVYVEALMAPYIKSGRAVLAVVFKGYIEREYPPGHKRPNGRSVEYGSVIVNRTIDLRRGLDYLETRGDIDSGKIAYCGVSGGASRDGLIFTAVEARYHSIILMGGGLFKRWTEWLPEFSPVNFVPHIRPPKLLLNGRYDEVFAFKTEAEPLYKLLREPKRLALFDGGHFAPLEVAAPIVNSWLDETLGQVKRER